MIDRGNKIYNLIQRNLVRKQGMIDREDRSTICELFDLAERIGELSLQGE